MKTENLTTVGTDVGRVDVADKAFGRAKFTDDMPAPGMLHAKLHTSSQAHARIKSIDTSEAQEVAGVHAIVTGEAFPYPVGPLMADRPPLATSKVRYYGEPIAVVVADREHQAEKAAALIHVEYEPLPVVNSPDDAMKKNAVLIHEDLGTYFLQVKNVLPVPNTNIANHTKIRKGDMKSGWNLSDETVEAELSFSPADHAALETRAVRVEISPEGKVKVFSSTQGPFYIKKLFSQSLNLKAGQIVVHTPLVGGAFGGKGTVQLEFIAYLASQAVGGTMVKLTNSREEDLITSPVHIGLKAKVKLGSTKDGKLRAAHFEFLFDSGAYSDMGAGMSKAAASDCTGPYTIDNVHCDSYCVYTNHPYATSFRGFSHPELTFVMERAMDMLADQLNMDPIELRLMNTIKAGDTTPTQVQLNASNVGDVTTCLTKARQLINWDEGQKISMENGKIIAKGICCLWKTSSTPSDAAAGVILTFNRDGSVNLNCAAVEIGQGTKTVLAQILAETMKLDMKKIHVSLEVDTQYDPHQWKTVASSTTYIAGRAVIAAGEDVVKQLKNTASIALKCMPGDLEVANGEVFVKGRHEYGIKIKDIATGYKYPDGNSVGGLVIGEGSYTVRHLTPLDVETGAGKPGPQWTVGAQAVEVEFDPHDFTYKILKAATVLDAGKVINPNAAIAQMRGGMYLGLSWAASESFTFAENGKVLNTQLRTYDTLRFGEVPEYLVDFVETPDIDGPYGARGIGEYGVIGMAGALANSLSTASDTNLNQLPLTPEFIWRTATGGKK